MFNNLILTAETAIAKTMIEDLRTRFGDGTRLINRSGANAYLQGLGLSAEDALSMCAKIWQNGVDMDGEPELSGYESREDCMTDFVGNQGMNLSDASRVCDDLAKSANWDDDDEVEKSLEGADAAVAKMAYIHKNAEQGYTLRVPREVIAKVCPDCARKMAAANLTVLKVRIKPEDEALAKAFVAKSGTSEGAHKGWETRHGGGESGKKEIGTVLNNGKGQFFVEVERRDEKGAYRQAIPVTKEQLKAAGLGQFDEVVISGDMLHGKATPKDWDEIYPLEKADNPEFSPGHKSAEEREEEGGFFRYCMGHIAQDSDEEQRKGLCASLHQKYLGRWPGEDKKENSVTKNASSVPEAERTAQIGEQFKMNTLEANQSGPNQLGKALGLSHAVNMLAKAGTSEGATKGWETRRGAGGQSEVAQEKMPLPTVYGHFADYFKKLATKLPPAGDISIHELNMDSVYKDYPDLSPGRIDNIAIESGVRVISDKSEAKPGIVNVLFSSRTSLSKSVGVLGSLLTSSVLRKSNTGPQNAEDDCCERCGALGEECDCDFDGDEAEAGYVEKANKKAAKPKAVPQPVKQPVEVEEPVEQEDAAAKPGKAPIDAATENMEQERAPAEGEEQPQKPSARKPSPPQQGGGKGKQQGPGASRLNDVAWNALSALQEAQQTDDFDALTTTVVQQLRAVREAASAEGREDVLDVLPSDQLLNEIESAATDPRIRDRALVRAETEGFGVLADILDRSDSNLAVSQLVSTLQKAMPEAVAKAGTSEGAKKGWETRHGVSQADLETQVKSERAEHVTDLHDNKTGWKKMNISSSLLNHDSVGTRLVSEDGKHYKDFKNADERSGASLMRAHTEAHAWAVDHPYPEIANDVAKAGTSEGARKGWETRKLVTGDAGTHPDEMKGLKPGEAVDIDGQKVTVTNIHNQMRSLSHTHPTDPTSTDSRTTKYPVTTVRGTLGEGIQTAKFTFGGMSHQKNENPDWSATKD